MKEQIKKHAELIQIISGIIIAAAASADMIGKPARLVNIIGLLAGAFGAGAGTGVLAIKKRFNKKKI
jgi:hypothetical protein